MKMLAESHDDGVRVEKCGVEIAVTLLHPPYSDEESRFRPGKSRFVVFDQESVRASDGVRLHYDFDRDGVVVEQASTFEWDADDAVRDPDWREVAFIKSWARAKPGTLDG